MTTGYLSPIGVEAQFFSNAGAVLASGKISTYLAGTTTATPTYTDGTLGTANANPIVLTTYGRLPAGVWQVGGVPIKVVISDSSSTVLMTIDNIAGIGDPATAGQQGIGQILYPRTALEIASLVTPLYYYYPPGDIRRYGAMAGADCTTAINNANASNLATFIPPGVWNFTAFTMPTTVGFVLYGVGTASTLQQTGAGITWPTLTSGTGTYQQYIRDLSFNATGTATSHTINTSFAQTITMMNLFCSNMPVGYDFIHVDGNATDGTSSHDIRIKNLQVYTATAGNAGVYMGALSEDSVLDGFIMNGAFSASYCIYIAPGAQAWAVSNSHPYNASINIVCGAGSSSSPSKGFTFDNVVFDYAHSNTVYLTYFVGTEFTGCWFQAEKPTFDEVVLYNCMNTSFNGCRWDTTIAGMARYCIIETGSTDYTAIIGGSINPSAYTEPYFAFNALNPVSHSTYKNVFGTPSVFGELVSFVGCTISAVTAGSTVYLGCNGAQPGQSLTGFPVPLPTGVSVLDCTVAFTVAPGAGTYTITLLNNGTPMTAATGSSNPLALTGSVFQGTINVSPGTASIVPQFNQLSIELHTSSSAGVPYVRYGITCIG